VKKKMRFLVWTAIIEDKGKWQTAMLRGVSFSGKSILEAEKIDISEK